jgi:hypothetical protein
MNFELMPNYNARMLPEQSSFTHSVWRFEETTGEHDFRKEQAGHVFAYSFENPLTRPTTIMR